MSYSFEKHLYEKFLEEKICLNLQHFTKWVLHSNIIVYFHIVLTNLKKKIVIAVIFENELHILNGLNYTLNIIASLENKITDII